MKYKTVFLLLLKVSPSKSDQCKELYENCKEDNDLCCDGLFCQPRPFGLVPICAKLHNSKYCIETFIILSVIFGHYFGLIHDYIILFKNLDCPCGRRCELFGGKIGYCHENNSACKDTDTPPNCSA